MIRKRTMVNWGLISNLSSDSLVVSLNVRFFLQGNVFKFQGEEIISCTMCSHIYPFRRR